MSSIESLAHEIIQSKELPFSALAFQPQTKEQKEKRLHIATVTVQNNSEKDDSSPAPTICTTP